MGGILAGIALRVPTPNVSVVDLVVQVEKKTFAEEVNEAFREAANGALKGILVVSDEPLVSKDFACSDQSSTIDSSLTMVMVSPAICRSVWLCLAMSCLVLLCLAYNLLYPVQSRCVLPCRAQACSVWFACLSVRPSVYPSTADPGGLDTGSSSREDPCVP